MSGEVRSVKVRLSVENAQAIAGMKQFGSATAATEKGIQRSAVSSRQALGTIEHGSRNVAIAGALALGVIEKANVSFDKQMSSVDASTHTTAKNMDLLRAASVKAGADTQYSATEAADGVEQLAKAGVKTKDILAGGLTGALNLASAGQLAVGDSAEYMATALTQFGLKGDKATHVADLLAAGAGKAQGEVSDMALALNYAGVPAAQLGVSIEQTAGTIALLAKNGILGEKAGTGLRGILSSLSSPSQVASKEMDRLGISVFDAHGNFIGLDGVAQQLHSRLGGLTQAERSNALGRIFGNAQLTAANVLYREGAKGVDRWTKNVNDSGYAADTAKRKMNNLAGDVEFLKGDLEATFIKRGSGAQSGLRDMVQDADKLVTKFNELPESVQSGTVKVIAMTTGIAGLVYGATKAVKAYDSVKNLGSVLTGGKKASTAVSAAEHLVAGGVQKVFVMNPGFGGVPGAGIPGVSSKTGKAAAEVGETAAATAAGSQVSKLGKFGGALGDIAKSPLMKKAGWVGVIVSAALAGKAFADADTKGHGVVDALQSITGKASLAGHQLTRFRDMDFLGHAATASEKAAEGMRSAAEGVQNGAAGFNAAYGAVSRVTPTMGKYAAVLHTIPKDIRSYVSTPGALLSMSSVGRLAQQYKLTPKQIRTVMELHGFSETQIRITQAGKAFRSLPKAVKTQLKQEGGVATMYQVKQLQQRYHLTPAEVRTVMKVSGVEQAKNYIHAVQLQLAGLHDKTITLHMRRDGSFTAPGTGGKITASADGSTVPKTGLPYADRHHYLLADGEEVVSNRHGQADRHRPLLKAINANRLADGGSVGAASGSSSGANAVTVIFPAPAVYSAAVTAANQIAASAVKASTAATTTAAATEKTVITAQDLRDVRLDDLHLQQQARDLQKSLAEHATKEVKVKEKGKNGKVHTVTKTVKTKAYALKGLDRLAAAAELADTQAQIAAARKQNAVEKILAADQAAAAKAAADAAAENAAAVAQAKADTEQARADAIQALQDQRDATTKTLTGTADIFARGASIGGAINTVNRDIADITAYGQTVAQLKVAGASPALLALLVSKAESGDFKSATKLGKALLNQPAALGQLNASLGTLGAVSANVASMTTDPRFSSAAAWNPTSQVVKQATVVLQADPSTWMTELTARVTHNVLTAMAET